MAQADHDRLAAFAVEIVADHQVQDRRIGGAGVIGGANVIAFSAGEGAVVAAPMTLCRMPS